MLRHGGDINIPSRVNLDPTYSIGSSAIQLQ